MKEIIELLAECNEFIEENPSEYGLELSVSDVKIIAAALEKQIAKRPVGISLTHDGRVANCPCCKKFITEQLSTNGCFYCLQKLVWGEKHD